jgi:chromosome segregation ATPase
MYFQNVTLDIKGNTMITGTNASGKSTIIDAIQYVLVGNLKSVRFNTAADEVTKRTLESYVRGYVNDDSTTYLRSGDVTSHVSLEFEDDKGFSIMGVVIDIVKSHTKAKFYFAENCSITDDIFIYEKNDAKVIRTLKEFSKYLTSNLGKSFETFPSVTAYHAKQRSYLGILPDKYSKLLPKAIGFKSISKVDSFVNDFLLDDSRIQIDGLKNNILKLNSLQKAIEEEQDKLLILKSISSEHKKYTDYEKRINENSVMMTRVLLEKAESNIRKKESDLSLLEGTIKQLKGNLLIKTEESNQINETITSLRIDQKSNKKFQTLDKVKQDLYRINIELDISTERLNRLNDILKKELNIIKSINNFETNQFNAIKSHLSSNKYTSETLRENLNIYNDEAIKLLRILENKKSMLDLGYKRLNREKNDLKETIKNLQNNKKPYPSYVYKLINSITDELFEKYGKNVVVQPLSDMTEIVHEEWRNAIEGYLNTQRFDIVLDPQYFNDALVVYDRLKRRENIYGIGIVDTIKYDNDMKVVKGTLADSIQTDNRFARNYLISILGKVKKVYELSDLNKHQISITKTCMTYKNNVARQIKKDVYLNPFIGTKSIKILLDIKLKVLKNVELELETLKIERDKVYKIINLLKTSKVNILIDSNNSLVPSVDQNKHYINLKNDLTKKITELENDPSLIDLSIRLGKEEQRFEKLKSEISGVNRKIGSQEEKLLNIRTDLQRLNNSIPELESNYQVKYAVYQYKDKLDNMYQNLLNEGQGDFDLVLQRIENSNRQYKSYSKTNEMKLVSIMTDYNLRYHFSANPQLIDIQKYMSEMDEIEFQNLSKYSNELLDFQKKTDDMFKENFVQELKSKIRYAKDQTDSLNKILKVRKFGEHQYQLKFGGAKSPELYDYYKLINDYDPDISLFNEGLTSKEKAISNRLFEELTNMENDKYAIDLLDYRNYIDVDIEIKSSTGSKLLSNVKHTQSGGESQVPYYIVAAASFQQLIVKNRNTSSSLCVVLFDEAFNNMDSQRVSSMMRFYKDLNIQIFLSLTGEKLHSIAKYVDSTIVIIRDGLVAEVLEFEGEFND